MNSVLNEITQMIEALSDVRRFNPDELSRARLKLSRLLAHFAEEGRFGKNTAAQENLLLTQKSTLTLNHLNFTKPGLTQSRSTKDMNCSTKLVEIFSIHSPQESIH